jgi:hypothetical protein
VRQKLLEGGAAGFALAGKIESRILGTRERRMNLGRAHAEALGQAHDGPRRILEDHQLEQYDDVLWLQHFRDSRIANFFISRIYRVLLQ